MFEFQSGREFFQEDLFYSIDEEKVPVMKMHRTPGYSRNCYLTNNSFLHSLLIVGDTVVDFYLTELSKYAQYAWYIIIVPRTISHLPDCACTNSRAVYVLHNLFSSLQIHQLTSIIHPTVRD